MVPFLSIISIAIWRIARIEHRLLLTTCEICLRYKQLAWCYSKFPFKIPPLGLWNEVAFDLIGPKTLQVQDQPYIFCAVSCIDPVTNLSQVIYIESNEFDHLLPSSHLFANCWLSCHYPRPDCCVRDKRVNLLVAHTSYCRRSIISRMFQSLLKLPKPMQSVNGRIRW